MNLKELSEILGLSQTTVSRALNGFPEVKESTRLRVAEAAARYKYRPNARAKSLATGRSYSIGHIIPLSSRKEIVNPIFADFIAGAGEVYSRRGYDMTLSVVRDEDEERAYRELASKGSVDGFILHGPKTDDPRIKMLQALGLPFVVHGRDQNAPTSYSWVDVNNKRAFKRATEFLLDIGHTRIGLINGNEASYFAARRREGYSEALQERGIAIDHSVMAADEMMESNGFEYVSAMLKLPDPPTAYLVSSVLLAIGARRALQDAGLTLGRDVSLVTHDDDLSYLPNSGDIPMFTAVRSSVREAGQKCADILLDVVEGDQQAPQHALWEAQLLVGASTGPGRQA